MTYKQRTDYLGIPVLGWGDRIHPDIELRKWRIVENMLVAGTQGVKNVVFDDGDFLVENSSDKEVRVRLLANGAVCAAHGLVDGFYFNVPAELVWEGLRQGYDYYLYITATHDLPHDRKAVRTAIGESRPSDIGLLMATIDFRDETPTLEPYPDGKTYSQDIARHCADSINPHGRNLAQDELTVKRLTVSGEVNIGGSPIPVAAFAETAASLAGRRVEKFDFVSSGPAGIVLKASTKVFAATVHRRSFGALFVGDLGEVAIGYFGEDPDVDEEQEFCVRNSGAVGISMRAVVICG